VAAHGKESNEFLRFIIWYITESHLNLNSEFRRLSSRLSLRHYSSQPPNPLSILS
jgi:hypothetical protein